MSCKNKYIDEITRCPVCKIPLANADNYAPVKKPLFIRRWFLALIITVVYITVFILAQVFKKGGDGTLIFTSIFFFLFGLAFLITPKGFFDELERLRASCSFRNADKLEMNTVMLIILRISGGVFLLIGFITALAPLWS